MTDDHLLNHKKWVIPAITSLIVGIVLIVFEMWLRQSDPISFKNYGETSIGKWIEDSASFYSRFGGDEQKIKYDSITGKLFLSVLGYTRKYDLLRGPKCYTLEKYEIDVSDIDPHKIIIECGGGGDLKESRLRISSKENKNRFKWERVYYSCFDRDEVTEIQSGKTNLIWLIAAFEEESEAVNKASKLREAFVQLVHVDQSE